MKEKAGTICAVIVTFNRKKLLLECLRALLNQTHPLNAILIVDNASTDGTPEYLKDKGFLDEIPEASNKLIEFHWKLKNNDTIHDIFYIRMHENTGGAGGFYEGIKKSYEKGYDWIWVMDDDAEPKENTLKILTTHHLFNNSKTGILTPIVFGINGKIQKYHHMLLDSFINEISALGNKDIYIQNISAMHNPIKLDANCFVGPLINRKAIDKIGFPIKELFIYADDLEYTYRISKKFNIYLIPNSIIFHKDFSTAIKIKKRHRLPFNSYWRTYYAIRNTIFLKRKYLHRYKKILFYFRLLIKFFRNIGGILAYDDNKLMRLKILLSAYWDGFKGNLGKRFLP